MALKDNNACVSIKAIPARSFSPSAYNLILPNADAHPELLLDKI